MAAVTQVTYARRMSAHDADPTVTGPHDPEHEPSATLAFEPEYAAALTQRLLATSGESAVVSSPLTGQPLAHIPQSSEADVAEAFRRARRAQVSLGPDAGRRAGRGRAPPARPGARPPGRDHRPDRVGVRQGPQERLRRAGPHRADRPLLRPPGRAAPRHRAARRALPRADADRRQPRPQGRRRDHQPLELPLHDGPLRRPAGAARGQRGGHQARRPDHAVGAAGRAAPRGRRLPARPLAGRRRARSRHRRRDRRRGRLRLLHRLDRDRPAHREGVRRAADRLLARAGWQEPDHRAARRRHREGRRGRGARVRSRTPASSACRWSGCSWPTRSTTGSSTASWPAPRR